MNKADPNRLVDDYVAFTSQALSDWQTIDAALAPVSNISLRRRAAADSFISLAVSWETFVSQWIVAAVNRDSSQALATLTGKLVNYARQDLSIPAGHLSRTLLTSGHLTLDEAKQVLDPKDWNVVIHNWKELGEYSKKWLADPYRKHAAAITSFQFQPAVLTRLIRNALVHQSTAALKEANKRVRSNSTPLALRWQKNRDLDVGGWRRYLLTISEKRIELLHLELTALAQRFRVP